MKNLEKQIKLLKKYNVTNYTIENGKITINVSLYLSSLTTADKDFLKGATINGYLDLRSLTTADKVRLNVKKLKAGYNAKKEYCFFDGILSKVLGVKQTKGYTIYITPFEYIAKKGKYTAHGKTLKQAISDLEFKKVSEKLKKEPIKNDTIINIQRYRLITGACESGVNNWINNNFKETEKKKVLKNGIKAIDLLTILEKTNAYGLSNFKKLMNK